MKKVFAIAAAAVLSVLAMVLLVLPTVIPAEEARPVKEPPGLAKLDRPGGNSSDTLPDHGDRIDAARKVNRDVVGWLTLPGTAVDGPVLQTTDNVYYLRRDINGRYDEWGCYFVDYECVTDSLEALSRVTIIYGHSLGDSADQPHFSQIKRYSDPEHAQAHPLVYFQLANGGACGWKVFAAGSVPVGLQYNRPDGDDETFLGLMDTLLAASVLDFPDSGVKAEDRILILSTCTSDPGQRYILAAKAVSSPSIRHAPALQEARQSKNIIFKAYFRRHF